MRGRGQGWERAAGSLSLPSGRMLRELVAVTRFVLMQTCWLHGSSGDSLFAVFKVQSISWPIDPAQR